MSGPDDREFRLSRNIGVGCVTAVAGLFSGGMIGVFIAKIVGGARRCEPETGVPACDWHLFALAGMAIGLLTLPALALRRLNSRGQEKGSSE